MDDITIIKDDIQLYISEYLEGLPDVLQGVIYTDRGAGVYRGLLNYLFQKVYKTRPGDRSRASGRSRVIDIKGLYNSYDIYKEVAFQFNKSLLIGDYSLLIGISTITFNKWCNDDYSDISINQSGINKDYKEFIEYIKDDMKNSLISNTVYNNSIGSIFLLKSTYGYSETPQKMLIETTAPAAPPDVIAARAAALLEGKKKGKMLD